MKNNQNGFAPVMIISAFATLIIVSALTTTLVSASKPGDLLYNVDLSLEDIQKSLAFTDDMKNGLYTDITKERLAEIQALYTEKNPNDQLIKDSLNKYHEAESELSKHFNKDNQLDDSERKLEGEIVLKSNEIEKLFENKQNILEKEREDLKNQYEQVKENGDPEQAQSLKVQINNYESLLNINEGERESVRYQSEIEKHQEEQNLESEKKTMDQKDEDSER